MTSSAMVSCSQRSNHVVLNLSDSVYKDLRLGEIKFSFISCSLLVIFIIATENGIIQAHVPKSVFFYSK